MISDEVKVKTAKILLVDDEPDMTTVIGRSLELEGFDVITAGDGWECIMMARSEMPDVILLDNVMPKMDGLTALEELRSSSETADIPVIIVTALADEDSIARALKGGANSYVVKPFDYELLLAKIAKVLPPEETLEQSSVGALD